MKAHTMMYDTSWLKSSALTPAQHREENGCLPVAVCLKSLLVVAPETVSSNQSTAAETHNPHQISQHMTFQVPSQTKNNAPDDIVIVSRREGKEGGVWGMETPRPSRWRCPAVLLLVVLFLRHHASATGTANATEHITDVPVLDWSEWDDPPPVLLFGRTRHGAPTGFSSGSCSTAACQQQRLRRLVHECSQQLKLPGLWCGDDADFVADDDYRVPFIASLPSCGFEVRSFDRCPRVVSTEGTLLSLAGVLSLPLTDL